MLDSRISFEKSIKSTHMYALRTYFLYQKAVMDSPSLYCLPPSYALLELLFYVSVFHSTGLFTPRHSFPGASEQVSSPSVGDKKETTKRRACSLTKRYIDSDSEDSPGSVT